MKTPDPAPDRSNETKVGSKTHDADFTAWGLGHQPLTPIILPSLPSWGQVQTSYSQAAVHL